MKSDVSLQYKSGLLGQLLWKSGPLGPRSEHIDPLGALASCFFQ
jgi:hypothetical protein